MNHSLFPETEQNNVVHFPTDYDQILERINNVNPLQYSKTRNFLNGAVTYLSPYISRGVVSVKQVMESVLEKGYKPYQIEKFLQELAWREYFQRVWQSMGNGIWNDIKQPQPDVLQLPYLFIYRFYPCCGIVSGFYHIMVQHIGLRLLDVVPYSIAH